MLPELDTIKKVVGRGGRQVVTFGDETRVTYGDVRSLFGTEVVIHIARQRIEDGRRYVLEAEITCARPKNRAQ